MSQARGQPMFSLTGQIINIFSFVGQIQLCPCSPKVAQTILTGKSVVVLKYKFTYKQEVGPIWPLCSSLLTPALDSVLSASHT